VVKPHSKKMPHDKITSVLVMKDVNYGTIKEHWQETRKLLI